MQNTVFKIHRGIPVSDGAGVKLTRLIGTPHLDHIDPFVMLDEFRSNDPNDYIAGFPPHPHRGIETFTYMKKGMFQHKDSTGQEGILGPGSVQWMKAARGIVHSEMPMMENGELWGYQLWINLPRDEKMSDPEYQNIKAEHIPVYEDEQKRVVVISGKLNGKTGPGKSTNDAVFFDVELKKDTIFSTDVGLEKRGFIYIYKGGIEVSTTGSKEEIFEKELVEFGEMEKISVKALANSGFIFLTARPNNEPIIKGGPFVMNTKGEIKQAFADYREGRF